MHLSITLVLTLNILAVQGGKLPWHNEREQDSEESSGESTTPCLCLPSFKCPGLEIVKLNKDCYDIAGDDLVCCPNSDQPLMNPSISSMILTQRPTGNYSQQGQLSEPTQILPLSMDGSCVCTPVNKCFDTETSSNQGDCTILNDVCCHNRVQPNANPSAQSQPQGPSNTSSSTSNCNCKLISDCYDDEFNNRKLEKGSCKKPNHVCCQELVQSQSPGVSLTTTQIPVLNQSPQAQPTNQTPVPPSPNDSGCACIPFFSCYDAETNSNLTGLVNDRIGNQCQDPNDVCCYNQVKPAEVIESTHSPTTVSTDCSGSCIPIGDCPSLSVTLEQASNGNSKAIETLRNLVCSKSNDNANVCCTEKGV